MLLAPSGNPMSETRSRRYIVMGEGVSASGRTLDEARSRFRDTLPRERRMVEPVRIPVNAEPERTFDGERFLESLDVLHTLRRKQAS
jgi:hypothetical protein